MAEQLRPRPVRGLNVIHMLTLRTEFRPDCRKRRQALAWGGLKPLTVKSKGLSYHLKLLLNAI